ncbi:MAG: family metallopeptidase [Chitinophagaceae bacterium]|nr:family metallopeptidase [Chitinophagaceae bacterium]
MKKIFLILLTAFGSQLTAFSQYWQQQVNYVIGVTLNDKDHTLDGFEKIEYTNNSPDTLRFIWFHVWPNAYKNDKTAFSDQLLENDNTKFYFSGKEDKGYINRLDFKVNGFTAQIEDHPEHIDIIKIVLPSPLAPAQTIKIATPFHVKLPYNFSRAGHDGDSYQLTQWYPKPAVYDARGWHPMPYLDQGEFYSEFGNFEVSITVPENYVVAATGNLENEEEKEWLKTRDNFSWRPVTKKVKLKSGTTKKTTQLYPASGAQTKTIRYVQHNVHDFAWFADKRFIVNYDTCRLASGKIIDVYAYYTPGQAATWKNSVRFSKDAVRFYSAQVGEYPFNVLSVVQGPASFGGGMEYPTITILSPVKSAKELDRVTAHEVGHNWFCGVLGTDERTHPWMDEGINSFYEQKYLEEKYKEAPSSTKILLETKAATKTDQPIETSSENFSEVNYALVAYFKTSEWVHWLETTTGKDNFQKAMQDYYTEWQFKHPQPVDFKNAIEKSTGQNLDSVFSYLSKTGLLPVDKRKGTAIATIFQPSHFNNLINNTTSSKKHIITLGPAIGFNSFDQLMVGGFVTNYKLPPSKFKFFIAPLYATGSRTFTGTGTLHYTSYPGTKLFRSLDFFLNGATFNTDSYQDSSGKKTFSGVRKLVPGFRFVLKEADPRSTMHRYIQGKVFIISEDGIVFGRDTIFNGMDTSIANSYKKTTENRTLGQLSLVAENNRALYPYKGELKAEYGKDFIRIAFTGNYFFNYSKGGGLNVRLFAGKFMYAGGETTTKQFRTDRYHLNMTGANGYEDYTYSDYFVGRNKFDGIASQQIMIRDGGFKVRTDLLANKTGKTDDWLVATNFTTSVFPKIPLKIFVDVGTYSDAWKKNAGLDHFLFEAGLQLSLFKEIVNIYLPLVYSNELKYYIQSYLPKKNRMLKTISFSIDIANFNLRKIDRNLVF